MTQRGSLTASGVRPPRRGARGVPTAVERRGWAEGLLAGLVVTSATWFAVACGGGGAERAAAPGGAATPASSTAMGRRTDRAGTRSASCAGVDAADVLARHVKGFGGAAAVAEELPRTIAGEASEAGQRGAVEIVLDRSRFRRATSIGGRYLASGRDATGAFSLGVAGYVDRPPASAATGPQALAWLLRREYVAAFRPQRDKAECVLAEDGGARLRLYFDLPEVGSPRLTFDTETGALLDAQYTEYADGISARTTSTFERWTLPDGRGVRWVSALLEHRPGRPAVESRLTTNAPGLACVTQLTRGSPRSRDCLSPPVPVLALAWPSPAGAAPRPTPLDPHAPPLETVDDGGAGAPASGQPVHVPIAWTGGVPLVRVTVGDRDVWALLAPGAARTEVRDDSPVANAFRPTEGATASDTDADAGKRSSGELATVRIGGLVVTRLPAVRAALPGGDRFAGREPEIALGASLLAALGVRIDYAGSEAVLAPNADALHDARAVALPVTLDGAGVHLDGSLEGDKIPVLLDLMSAEALLLPKPWAQEHGLPGGRRSVDLPEAEGAAERPAAAADLLFRFGRLTVGPLDVQGGVARIGSGDALFGADATAPAATPASRAESSAPEPRLGNGALATCHAVVLDLMHRRLWVEPPCDRPVAEEKSGLVLHRTVDPTAPDRPWVVAAILPGSAAARAGAELGDRLLEVGGKPATLDPAGMRSAFERPAATRVGVTVSRHGAKKRLTLELAPLP